MAAILKMGAVFSYNSARHVIYTSKNAPDSSVYISGCHTDSLVPLTLLKFQ